MTSLELRNAILQLRFINRDEFCAELFDQVYSHLPARDLALWSDFRKDQFKFYAHASDAHRDSLFAIIQKRLTIGARNDDQN